MQSNAKTVDEYLSGIPEDRHAALAALRKLIKSAAPLARESMQYGMPAYEINGILIGLASQKQHMAFYCCDEVMDRYRSKLGKLDCGKGCIRFRRIEDLPLEVLAAMLREVAQSQIREPQASGPHSRSNKKLDRTAPAPPAT